METLRHLSQKYAIEMLDKTFFQLIEKIIGFETINFVGEPLNGLQVMGVLETRTLDFKNIIILSMNDRIFPANITLNHLFQIHCVDAMEWQPLSFRKACMHIIFIDLYLNPKP